MNRANPKIVLISSILIGLVIAYWGIAFNKASIIVESSLEKYTVKISDKINECASASCEYTVKPRSYTLHVSAKGYTEEEIEINLERGETYKFNYEPIKIPEIQETNMRQTEYNPAQLRMSTNGEQVLWINLGETLGEQQITRFPNPLAKPLLSASPSLNTVFVGDNNKYWLVDTRKKTKKTYEFAVENSPSRFRLISDELSIIQIDSKFKIYNLKSGQNVDLPIENLNHVIADGKGNIIMLSRSELDQIQSDKPQANLLDLINKSGEEILNPDTTKNLTLYFYIPSESRYIKINELPPSTYSSNPSLRRSENGIYLYTPLKDYQLNL